MGEHTKQPATLFGLDDDETEEVLHTLSNAALVRAVIVATIGLAGSIVGRELGAEWLDPFIDVYSLTVVPALGWWIRRRLNRSK